MQARRLIERSTFGPDALRIISKAFDAAWAEIAPHFDGETAAARTRLAHAVLIVAREDSRDPVGLKNEALQVMALAYRDRSFAQANLEEERA